jgi:hypothetical protein
MSSFYGKNVSDTFKTLIHFGETVTSDGVKDVFDGQGIKTSVSLGISGSGLSVSGAISGDSSLSIASDVTIGGNINLPTQSTVNDLIINPTNSQYSIETEKSAAFGTIRIEDSTNKYQLIFGSRSLPDYKWKVDVDTDNTLNFRRNSETVPPMYLDSADGSVHIKTLVLATPPQITTTPVSATNDSDVLVLGYFTGTSNNSMSTVATSGFQRLPNGLIEQWGTSQVTTNVAGTTINFNFAFPTSVINVVATPNDDYSLLTNYMGGTYAKPTGNGAFKAMIKGTQGTPLSGYINWRAIGH